jgi:hypothetical protein
VDGITGEEDQERDELKIPDEKFGMWIEGPPPPTEPWRIVEPGIEVEVRGERYLIGDCNDVLGIGAFGAEFTRDDIERWRRVDREAAYRAGREDLLRSGSCPECTAGDPHNEPDVPHIHLTPYGYLLYAADHERPGFIEEIRAVERRAGREDAARDILDVLRQREDAAHETYARRQALGVGDQAAEWAVRSRTWRQARQAADEAAIAVGDGVQPTEEQRARDEDRERGEEES